MSGNLTPHLRLTKPDYNSSGWDVPTNQNWQLIDNAFALFVGVANIRGVWQNSTLYLVDNLVTDDVTFVTYAAKVEHTSSAHPTTFAEDRAAHPTYWEVLDTAQAYALSAASSAAAADASEANALTHAQSALTFAQAAATSAGDAAEQAQAAYDAAVVSSNTALSSQASKNKLINASFMVWQTGTTFSGLVGPSYGPDMWIMDGCTAGARVTDTVLPYTFSLSVTGPTSPSIRQNIESYIAQTLAAKFVNFSIWVKNVSGTSTLHAQLAVPTVEDNFGAVTLVGSAQTFAAPTNQWTRVNFTYLVPIEAERGLQIMWFRGTGSATTTLYTGARAEHVLYSTSGPSADDILWPSVENEACMRYLRRIQYFFGQNMIAGEFIQQMVAFSPMRTIPVATWQTPGTLSNISGTPGLSAYISTVVVEIDAVAADFTSIENSIILLDARL